jgi:cysteinyl-tRNA synthetase
MHGEYLLINGGKMSKSLNNVYLLKDIEARGYDPLVYRLFTYSSSYRTKINFTWEAIDSSSKALEKLRIGYQNHLNGNDKIAEEEIEKYEEDFHKAINDDLNMPLALSVVWDVIKNSKKSKQFAELLLKFDSVLGLKIDKGIEEKNQEIPQEVLDLAEQRKIARENKDWAESDRIRDEITSMGYSIKDNKDGYEISNK